MAWQKTSSLVNFGSTWNLNGVGKVYVTGATSFSQTVSIGASRKFRCWFAGNGVDSYLVSSATVSKDGKSVVVRVSGKTSFYVPKEGRYSDWIEVRNWDLPGDVVFTFSVANVSQKIPATAFAPTTPVVVSGYLYEVPIEELPEHDLEEEEGDYIDTLPYADYFGSIGDWEKYFVGDGGSIEINEGLHFHIEATDPEAGTTASVSISPFISSLPDKFTVKITVQVDEIPEGSGFSIDIVESGCDNILCVLTSEEQAEGGGAVYFPISGGLQEFMWKVDKKGSTFDNYNPVILYYYNTQFKGSVTYFGASSTPFSPTYIEIAASTQYEVGPLDITIKSIEIYEGWPDNDTLTEVTSTCTLTITTNPDPGDTLVLKGGQQGDITFTFVDHYPNNQNEIQIGADTNETASAIATAINNYTLAEFSAEASTNTVIVTSHISGEMTIEITGTGISVGTIISIHPGFLDEEVSAADSFTVTEGGKSVQENASASDAVDGLIDGLSETVSATAVIDCLMDSMDENANASAASDNFDGLIDYMGDET